MDLHQIKRIIAAGRYHPSAKVDALLEHGEFDLEDLETAILSAARIHKRERDEKRSSVDGYKYTIIGRDRAGLPFYTCGKVRQDHFGNFYFFITAHHAA